MSATRNTSGDAIGPHTAARSLDLADTHQPGPTDEAMVMSQERFTFGFWHSLDISECDEKTVDDWHEAGITVPQSPRYQDTPQDKGKLRWMLDACAERGMQAILLDPRTRVPGGSWEGRTPLPLDYREGCKSAVWDFGNHPGVKGFFLRDEPPKSVLKAVCDAHRIMLDLAPDKLPYINQYPYHGDIAQLYGFISWPEYLDRFVETANATQLSYDCYCQMMEGPSENPLYFQNLEFMRDAALRHRIPFWNIILATPHFRYRAPSKDDMRWQLYTSLAYGCGGLLYFTWYTPLLSNYRDGPIDAHGERSERWYMIRDLHRDFRARFEQVYLRLRSQQVCHWPDAPEGSRVLDGTGLVAEIKSDGDDGEFVVGEFLDERNRPWVMVVNRSPRHSTQAHLTFRTPPKAWYMLDYQGKEVIASGDARPPGAAHAAVWLAPGWAELIRVEF